MRGISARNCWAKYVWSSGPPQSGQRSGRRGDRGLARAVAAFHDRTENDVVRQIEVPVPVPDFIAEVPGHTGAAQHFIKRHLVAGVLAEFAGYQVKEFVLFNRHAENLRVDIVLDHWTPPIN